MPTGQTFTSPIRPTLEIMDSLRKNEITFREVRIDHLEAPIEVWEWLINDLKKPEQYREVNGCGSESTWFVPDTNYGLCITPICHIHDVTHKLSKTPEDCTLSNKLLLTNHITFIDDNSRYGVVAWFRRYRATSYYSSTHVARKTFCKGFKNENN